MNTLVGFAVGLVALILILWALAAWMRQRSEAQVASLRQEFQASLASQTQTVVTHLGQLTQAVTQQLGQVTQQLQSGVAASGQLVTQTQQAVARELQDLGQQIGAMQEAGRELSQAAKTIETVLGGAKTRGTLGEIALERMLEDALPRSAYETQCRFSTGAVVDAVLRVGEKVVPVDSKFPLDAYRRMFELGGQAREAARKEFARAVRVHADSIAEKYILPAEGSLDYAFMFVPSEGVYYEFLMTEDTKAGPLADYCRSKRVFPVSPNTFYAYLHTILMGLRGMQIEENARRLLASLAGLKKQLDGFVEVYERLGTHLRNAQQSYTEAERKLERAHATLDQMAQGTLPEPSETALEATAQE